METTDKLIREYKKRIEIGLREILDFYVQFEKIALLKDRKGRLDRLLMFKECLRNNVMPFIIDDKHRGSYNQEIANWETDHQF